MNVAELKSRLSIFHHIADTDSILIECRDEVAGTTKLFNLQDIYKVTIKGRQLPVLVMSTDPEEIPDTIDGRYRITPMNGEDYWVCSTCGTEVGELDKFCKNCGKQLKV